MNLTLVTYYGAKPDPLREFIKDVQGELGEAFGAAFEAYVEEQVHGTVVGLEGTRLGDYVINQNYLEQRRLLKAVNLPKLFELLKGSEHIPFTVQIGGYERAREYQFTSRGQHPYLRSFSVQGSIAVAMGWPVRDGTYAPTLDELRRSFNGANVLHKFHASPADVDNDFYFVLGRIDRNRAGDEAVQAAQERMREYLGRREPFFVTIDRDSLGVVVYRDTRLPWGGCLVYPLEEAEANASQLSKMYDDPAA